MPRRNRGWDYYPSLSLASTAPRLKKICDDRWNSNPPQITSFLVYGNAPSNPSTIESHTSTHGFGWRFKIVDAGWDKLSLMFDPLKSSSMTLSNIAVDVKASYPGAPIEVEEGTFSCTISLGSGRMVLGTFPSPSGGRIMQFEITLTFDASHGLSLPSSLPTDITQSFTKAKRALCYSLDEPSFIDTKFYLFSARINGQPACPKPVYATSALLIDCTSYLRDLLLTGSGFGSGTPCDIRKEVPEEIAKLDATSFEYDSDSDLEDMESEEVSHEVTASSSSQSNGNGTIDGRTLSSPQDGRAFAVTGTAHKTWRAFILYVYMNDITFNPMKSEHAPSSSPALVSCSPKSVYRLADYVGLSSLKSLAKENIEKRLSKSNIIIELFSSFTYRYPEIIELEVDYLIKNFTTDICRDLNTEIRVLMLGMKPHCSRVLAFIMGKLLSGDTRRAWHMVDYGVADDSREEKPRKTSTIAIVDDRKKEG